MFLWWPSLTGTHSTREPGRNTRVYTLRSRPLPLALTATEEDVASDPFVVQGHTVLTALVVSHLAGLIDELHSTAHPHACHANTAQTVTLLAGRRRSQ